MARINQILLEKIQNKLGLGPRRVYELIDAKVRRAHLPRPLAAIAVAAENGINISRFATPEDLAALRSTSINTASDSVILQTSPTTLQSGVQRTGRARGKARPVKRQGTTVFVVHGRDIAARDAVFAFLRSLGLRPLEWTQALKLTRKGSPYVGEVLDAAFNEAAAIIVLLTPDDEAILRREFLTTRDPSYERNLTGQARPNVLFEAGMAFGKNPKSTVLVQVGDLRPFSDIGGRHVVHLSNSAHSRQEFATKLSNAGCNVDITGTDWLTVGDFQPRALSTAPRRTQMKRTG